MDDSIGERRDTEGAPDRGEPKPNSGEFEKLLELAEDLQRERDRERAALELYTQRTYVFALLCAFFGVGLAGIVAAPASVPDALLAVLVAVLAASLAVGIRGMWRDQRSKASKRRELEASERALYETVQILRETEQVFAEGWSTLERARFRIKLSRFDIGPYDSRYARAPKSSSY